MSREPLLIEIGCEEIPARMIRDAADDLASRVVGILERSALESGTATVWAGPRRLAVRVESVQGRQQDRDEQVIGPPASVAFSDDGGLSRAALGFAKKQQVDPASLERLTTDKGEYVAVQRRVKGRSVGQVLEAALPQAVESMTFPKTMRWADGRRRWVRPVHWVVALHGTAVLPVKLFGLRAGDESAGHRFLSRKPVKIRHPDQYLSALEKAHVAADPAERRRRLEQGLAAAAVGLGGRLVEDEALLQEVAELVEWPGSVGGEFDSDFLALPRELLVTTLRHHQKCFSVQDDEGRLLAAFVAVANTDRDPATHIRRGNEWVIGGRLDDARFFWREDLERPLSGRSAELEGVVFHAKLGTFAEKARRMASIAGRLAAQLGLGESQRIHCTEAASLSKVDLVCGTVGEFPELQGQAGGLLLAAEGRAEGIARGVYEHYQPVGAEDAVPASVVGAVVSVADKLDTIASMVGIGEKPTGSRDPFGIRRAATGLFRTLIEKDWPVSLRELADLAQAGNDDLPSFLLDRFQKFLRDAEYTPNEIHAVFRRNVSPAEGLGWPLGDIRQRLEAIRTVRPRRDFAQLADLTKRVDNILSKGAEQFARASEEVGDPGGYREGSEAAVALGALVVRHAATMTELVREHQYGKAVDLLAQFVDPVERFFDEVLVLDPSQPRSMLHRKELLTRLRGVLTRCFDIRELAGQADRRPS
jgi:glycyl-tRNA synthetase beta chain